MSGRPAIAKGFVTAAQKSGLTFYQGSYPITPASDILHELSQYKDFGVMTFQAEDEIAAITSAIGAAYAGALAITTTSGPGMALKTEALGLAVALEIPLLICDIQRGVPAIGPTTGIGTIRRSPGPCPAFRALSTASAASKSRMSPATSTTSRSTTSTWCASARQKLPPSSRKFPTWFQSATPKAIFSSSPGARPTAPSPPP